MILSREQVTGLILAEKKRCNLKWSYVAQQVGESKEWTTAACLGQMQMNKKQAEVVGHLFGLTDEAIAWLQIVPPSKGSPGIPHDPLLYRMHEVLGVYGRTISELVHEEFGDGIMSAIDFKLDIQRDPDPAGDRVKMTWSGKFLPYKPF
ncbi:hypothetical protein AB6A40_009725 [Gnathostoma spinigerum]|uniref:Cyanate hydratase n=1 Tax=Gnathostoma spinigerum TaxID=75299 RepID=A0ABD6ET35_9BILA